MYRMARELKPHGFERAFIFSGRWHFALLARLAGIRLRLGFGFGLAQRLFLTRGPYIPRYAGTGLHVFRDASAFAVAQGLCEAPVPPKMRLPDTSIASAKALIDDLPHPRAALAIGTSEVHKHWGDDRFAALATALRKRGFTVICVGGPADKQSAERIRAGVPAELQAGVRLMNQPSVLVSAAVVRQCDLVVGNDTGVVNMGPANDVPTVCILGNRGVLDQDPLMHCIRAEKLADITLGEVMQHVSGIELRERDSTSLT
jgi:heptosyltransferase-2